MRKNSYISLMLVLVLAISLAIPMVMPAEALSAADFTDVPYDSWYYSAVDYVATHGLFNGTSSTRFSPKGTMTRGMFVTVLGRYAGVDPLQWCTATVTGSDVNFRSGPGTNYSVLGSMSKNETVTILGQSGSWYKIRRGSQEGYASGDYISPKYHRFLDVDYSSYYAGYTIWGYEKGIVSGVSDSYFAPTSDVTREQICRLLYGYVSAAGMSLANNAAATVFSDQGSISSWATQSVSAMQRAGVVQGSPSGSGLVFRPRSSATRAEAAAMFQRFSQATSGGSGSIAGTPAPTPTAPPTATTTPTPSNTEPPVNTGTPSATDPPGASSPPNATPTPVPQPGSITPASFANGSISVRTDTIRVGILADTLNFRQAKQSVTLENLSGGTFEYGTFDSGRHFSSAGSLSASTVTVTTDGSTFTVKDSSGNVLYTGGGNLAIHPVSGTKTVTRVNGEYRYYGNFELRQSSYNTGRITVINYVNIEDYVKGVIPYEFSNEWPTETLKAAAIVSRNFVYTCDWSAYEKYGIDVLAESGAQTYRGRAITYSEGYFTNSDAAVDATSGVYLTYGGRMCTTFYFSSDGGATEDAAHVWGSSYPYLIGKPDPYEASAGSQASNYQYSITNSRTGSTMSSLASRAGLKSTLAKNGVRIETYPATGNVKSITLIDVNGNTATISQNSSFSRWDFLSAFGFTAYSYNYIVTYNEAQDTFTCTRHGWGHNVGMSQWGAYAMARYYNKNYQEILGFYFDGTNLQYGAY